ncbi:hypothetical protein H0H93_007447 [Arthromyces matolae]|nr:hypothetical protein H0H93_007447 [Arthromyces matolae]
MKDERTRKMTNAGRPQGEGKAHDGIKPQPIHYPPGSGKAHAAGEEQCKSRTPSPEKTRDLSEDEFALEARGKNKDPAMTWKDVSRDKRYKQTGKLAPHSGEPDPHITYRKKEETVTNYQGWQKNEHTVGEND